MQNPMWKEQNINIRPPNYSKENFLETFTPQTQLTPEQIFWFKYLLKKKAKALEEQAKDPKPIPVLTVYPPNTSANQNAIDRKCDEIEKKNLLITNENLIANCIAHDVFYTATDFVLTVSRNCPALHERIEHFQTENEKVKLHYQELFDSIKLTWIKTIAKTTFLLNEIENLKTRLKGKMPSITSDTIKSKVSTVEKYAIDVGPIPSCHKNNRNVHPSYLNRLKDTLDTLRKIVKEARNERSSDNDLEYVCVYIKTSQELLEHVIASCPKAVNKRDKFIATTPFTRKKQVTFVEPCETSNNNTSTHVKQQNEKKTNVPVLPSTGVNGVTKASGSKPRSNTKNDRTSRAKSVPKKTVEDYLRNNKSDLHKQTRVDSSISYKRTCPLTRITKSKVVLVRQWKPTGRIIPLRGQCPLIRSTTSTSGPTVAKPQVTNAPVKCCTDRPVVFGLRLLKTYNRESLTAQEFHKEVLGQLDLATIILVQLWVTRIMLLVTVDLEGVDLLKGHRGFNLCTISVEDTMKSSPICLLSKASQKKSWLWYRRLNNLNFCTINDLARKDLVRGLPRLKFEKDHLCSACQLRKSKNYSYKPKTESTNLEVLHTLHMELCELMRVQSINGKKYILVIIDDYLRFTWVKFLRSKDETPDFVVTFLKQIQVGLNKTVRFIRTNNGTKFVNHVLTAFYEQVGITHQTSVLRTPQQNDIVER
ncbi:retrovirus-related pol polyprotein from transposon TNT 1-94 [Tanacetum coccineum]|uniref:Retrovirus-related pol polyprotein from transposon TNT 1-94 n=1 Tax=Tanacetum coccineum TaxID=301880 RepID=A0ABQ4Z0Q5_9ASTR